jgi:hypothetical protein
MRAWSPRQLAAIGALAAGAILIVGFAIGGSTPKFNDDALKIVGYFHSHHKKVLVSLVLVEIGVAFLIVLISQLASTLRAAGQGAEASIVSIAGAASVGTLAVGYGLFGGLAQLATFGQESAAVPPLYRLIQFVQVGWYWTTLVLVGAVALAAWNGAFPRWAVATNGLVAILLLLGGISVKGKGALAAGTGALAAIAGIAFVVWVLHLGVLFWWKPRAAPAPASQTV